MLKDIKTFQFNERSVPENKDDEILLKVSHCALCRTDAKMWESGHRDLILPRIIGHEICGCIQGTNEYFVAWPGKACGCCFQCKRKLENLCVEMQITGFHRDGGLAEFVSLPKRSLVAVPKELPKHIASFAEPLACCLNALDQAEVTRNEQVLIYGGGTVGLLMAMATIDRGAIPFVIEKNRLKFEKSKGFRGNLGIDGMVLSLEKERSEFDVVINATSSLNVLSEGISRLRSGGYYCLFSGFVEKTHIPISLINEIHYRQIHIVGAYGCTHHQMERAVKILHHYQKEVAFLIEEIITLEEVSDVITKILKGTVFKYIVEF
ncbi:alcohol dehydrogenase catalytic domain-containing protein [bacterium]|nr:alcohol dehydrogenase catalytic domain-containing protein [bacterium]